MTRSPARGDWLASLIVFVVALPLSLGIAVASGAPPATGLITAVIGGVIVGSLSGAPLVVSGPAAGLTALVFQVIQQHGWAQLGLITALAGALQLVLGMARLGRMVALIPRAVLEGVLSAIGLLILAGQLHVMIGEGVPLDPVRSALTLGSSLLAATEGFTALRPALACGLLGLLVQLLWKPLFRTLSWIPAGLPAVVVPTTLAFFAQWELPRVQIASLSGGITGALTSFFSPRELTGANSPHLILLTAAGLAIVASAETLLTARAVDVLVSKRRNFRPSNLNRELLAQGAGNLLAGIVGALPITGVMVRSATNVEAGAETRWSTILHGIWIALLVSSVPTTLNQIPLAALASVLVLTGARLANFKSWWRELQHSPLDGALWAGTVLAVFATNLLDGLLISLAGAALIRVVPLWLTRARARILSRLGLGLLVLASQTHAAQTPGRTGRCLRQVLSVEADLAIGFRQLLEGAPDEKELIRRATRWVSSDERALHLYKNLGRFGPAAPRVLNELMSGNPYFQKETFAVEGAPGTLLTFSFEKETHSPEVTGYFRHPSFSDERWLATDPRTRAEALRDVTPTFQSLGRLSRLLGGKAPVATAFKPEFIGSLSKELPMQSLHSRGVNLGTPPLEIRHGSYEISLDRTIDQMSLVARDLKETDAFHLHLVTELPRDYDAHAMKQFGLWFKSLNDRLTLLGMEEGLHPSAMTDLVKLDAFPTLPEKIGDRNFKYFSAGLRGGIYGQAAHAEKIRIGIELRDATRDFETLRRISHGIADSLARRAWERQDLTAARKMALDLREPSRQAETVEFLMVSGMDAAWAKRLPSIEPSIALPFQRFEVQATEAGLKVDASIAREISEARAHYLRELKTVVDEIGRMNASREKIDEDDVRMALRMVLTDWAKRARASRLYEKQ